MKKIFVKLKRIRPEFFYRLALGLSFIILGYNKLTQSAGLSFVRQPAWLEFIINTAGREEFFLLLGVIEIFLGALILLWFLQYKYVRNVAGFIFFYSCFIFWLSGSAFKEIIIPILALGVFVEYWRRY
ncbi:MAG TPA: hypothetical protein ENN31_01815 [Candidatus Vogelbacteria bacterium]|nr:hypothetical protein [Candidatus Vogelbacteria bacterium]